MPDSWFPSTALGWWITFAVISAGALVAVVLLRRRRREISELSHQNQSLALQLAAVSQHAQVGVLVVSKYGNVTFASELAVRLLGLPAQVVGAPLSSIQVSAVDEQQRPLLVQDFLRSDPLRQSTRIVGVPALPGGKGWRWLQIELWDYSVFEGEIPFTVATIRDDTTVLQKARHLVSSEIQFQRAFDSAPTGMALVTLDWRINVANRAFADLTGLSEDRLSGFPLAALTDPQDRAGEDAQLQQLLDGAQEQFAFEKRLVRADGSFLWVVMQVTVVYESDDQPAFFVVQIRDATSDRLRAEVLTHRAMHDPLTGLANRALLHDVMRRMLTLPDATSTVAVLMVDLDSFKHLNDSFGHAYGDAALVKMAEVLRQSSPQRATIARTGGDEFVILLQDVERGPRIFEVANAIQAATAAPFHIRNHSVRLQSSIGIALVDASMVAGGVAGVLAAADAALYSAKASGKGRTVVFEPTMHTEGNSGYLAAEARAGISRGEFVLHFQPIVHLQTGRTVGFEGLLRWQHPQRGLLLPYSFWDHITDPELFSALTVLAIDQAVEFLNRLSQLNGEKIWVSVNIAEHLLGQENLVDYIRQAMAREQISSQQLVVEVAEDRSGVTDKRVKRELSELALHGIPVLIDDFGAGKTELTYLRDLAVAGIKLDASFLSGSNELGMRNSTRAVTGLGQLIRTLGVVGVAKGVETEEQRAVADQAGWQLGQGWLFGPAGDADSILASTSALQTFLIPPARL